MPPNLTRILALVGFVLAAVAADRSASVPWGRAEGPAGTWYRVAAAGIDMMSEAGAGPLRTCRWFPRRGEAVLCAAAAGADQAFTRLRYAYPSLQGGAWLAFLGGVVVALAGPAGRKFALGLGFAAAALVALGGGLVLSALPHAVELLAPRAFQFRPPGIIAGLAALLLALAATWFTSKMGSPGGGPETTP